VLDDTVSTKRALAQLKVADELRRDSA